MAIVNDVRMFLSLIKLIIPLKLLTCLLPNPYLSLLTACYLRNLILEHEGALVCHDHVVVGILGLIAEASVERVLGAMRFKHLQIESES